MLQFFIESIFDALFLRKAVESLLPFNDCGPMLPVTLPLNGDMGVVGAKIKIKF